MVEIVSVIRRWCSTILRDNEFSRDWMRKQVYPRIITAVLCRFARRLIRFDSYISVSSTISSDIISYATASTNLDLKSDEASGAYLNDIYNQQRILFANRTSRHGWNGPSSVTTPSAPPSLPGVSLINMRCALPVWLREVESTIAYRGGFELMNRPESSQIIQCLEAIDAGQSFGQNR